MINPFPEWCKAITPALVEGLRKDFPLSNPSPGDPMEAIMYRAGQVSVWKFMEQHLELLAERAAEQAQAARGEDSRVADVPFGSAPAEWADA